MRILKLATFGACVTLSTHAFSEPLQGDGKVLADARLRLETVDQQGFADDATALTMRLRLGYETPVWNHLQGVIEFEHVEALVEDYNSTTNGETARPTVLDPEATEINRLQLAWTPDAAFTATIGRQRIVHDDARFLGDVGFRQNQQTFDAVRAEWRPNASVGVEYAYLDRIQRILGPDSSAGAIDSDSHVLRARHAPNENVEVVGYGYLLDFERVLPSSDTWGARVNVRHALSGGWRVEGLGEFARQSENDGAAFDLNFWRVSGTLKRGGLSASLRREVLEGDGVRGFATPLATLHAYQGWADVFVNTPADGVVDTAATISYAWSMEGPISRPSLTLVAQDFESDRNTRDFGRELGLRFGASLPHGLGIEAKLASFNGDSGFADRDKMWLSLSWSH